MTALIDSLIDKTDTFELVRDRVALIIAEESAAQQVIAAGTDGKNPDDWKLRVFIERSTPWDLFTTSEGTPPTDLSAIVNVSFDEMMVDIPSSQISLKQQYDAVINIDVLGMGVSKINTDGHSLGDESAARMAQKAARLIRNILMSDKYRTLGFDRTLDIAGQRMVRGIKTFQAEYVNSAYVSSLRLTLDVKLAELSASASHTILETINTITFDINGMVLVAADFAKTED